jgi:hypothetical protein
MLDRKTLVDEHMALEAMAIDLSLHAQARPLDRGEIARTRWRLGRMLLAHLAQEDSVLHPLLQRGPCPVAAAMSRQLAHEMGGLADGFKAYIADWDGERMDADPDGFERATCDLVAALSDRIRVEETQLYRHIPDVTRPRTVDVGVRRA